MGRIIVKGFGQAKNSGENLFLHRVQDTKSKAYFFFFTATALQD